MTHRRSMRTRIIIACVCTLAVLAALFGLGAAWLYRTPADASRPDEAARRAIAAFLVRDDVWRLDPESTVSAEPASVKGVIDGDSITVQLSDGTPEEIRLIGLDTPELSSQRDNYGTRCAERTAQALAGSPTVFLETGPQLRDKYGRMLAYVWLAPPGERPSAEYVRDTMLNAQLLVDGFAKVYTRAPNDRYAGLFEDCAKQAEESGLGLWDPKVAEEYGPSASWSSSISFDPGASEAPYVGNAASKYFHRLACRNAKKMRVSNRVPLQTREQALAEGFVPCGICDP